MSEIPSTAKAVIIGGGIIGCSTAYHLANLGWRDTVLLERKKLTSGSTFHAAGLVGQLRSNANITQLLGYSIELYQKLEEETGLATGWKMNGGLRLACNEARWSEVKRQATTAHSFGLEMQLLTPKEAQALWPLMNVDDVIGAAFLPTDGQANPSDITQALARGARLAGVKIFEDCRVDEILIENEKVVGVRTQDGIIQCEKVIVCAGQWSRQIGLKSGVNIPLVSVEHQYLISEPIDGVTGDLPTLRDPDRLTYYKEEVGGLVMGGYEQNPIAWARDGIPKGFHYTLLDSNFDHFEPLMELALGRVPALENTGIKDLTNGPESFTPDGNFILGEAPEVKNFFVGAGFNAFGIASGGGAGMALAHWVTEGEPPFDLWPVDIRRFGNVHKDTDWVRTRTLEAYGKHYTIAWPSEEHSSGRPNRQSPLYDALKAKGACFGEKLGWERANWFADAALGETPRDQYSFERPNWFEAVGREHQAVRERAGLFDQTSFAKYLLKGVDAEPALNWICANNIAKPVGSLTYTQMLNDRGGIECDLTIGRVAEDEFYIVTGTGFATHDFDWIRRNIPSAMAAEITDITAQYGVLSLMGPNSRAILEQVCSVDLSNSGFAFGQMRNVSIADVDLRALRVTYVGELGWELHIPIAAMAVVYEAIVTAGKRFGLEHAGYRAIESLRLEKGYRAWGADIGPDHTPLEAGLGWAVKLKSGLDFKGKKAIEIQKQNGIRKMLAGFSLDDDNAVLLGRETIYRNGERVGWLSSGGHGYTVGKSIGYGYIRQPVPITREFVENGEYELEIATHRVPAKLHLSPLHDPQMVRVKS